MKRQTIGLLTVAVAALLFSAIQLSARTESATAAPSVAISTQSPVAAYSFVVAADGNSARYRVREQLAGFDLPNDAIGETRNVSGSVGLDKSGNVIPAASHIIVNMDSMRSDKDRRDGYVKRRLLEVDRYPVVELEVTGIRGMKLPMPRTGTRSFTLDGNLTVHGVAKPTIWNVDAIFTDSVVTGKAMTRFTFGDFELTKPRIPVVLSVADTIALEYDFKLVRSKTGK